MIDNSLKALRSCFDPHLNFLDAFNNMMKHAPAMGFYHMALSADEKGSIVAAIYVDQRYPMFPEYKIPKAGTFKYGEIEHEFPFVAYDKSRLDREVDLNFALELHSFIGEKLSNIGNELFLYQLSLNK